MRRAQIHLLGTAATRLPLTLTIPAGSPIRVSVHDISYGLPHLTGHTFKARPADTMSGLAFAGDATLVSRTITLQ